MPSIFGRAVILAMTNKSGGALARGDICVLDSSNNEAVTTTTTSGYTGIIGVVVEENGIANNQAGRVQFAGYCPLVTPDASVTRGNFGKAHSVAKQATDMGAARGAGAFCQFLKSGTTPSAILFGLTDGTGVGMTNPLTTTGDMVYSSSGATPARLAAVATGKVLKSAGASTAPAWGYVPFHGCRALANANTSMPTSGTEYPIAFAAADSYDSDAYHDPASNNTRMTIPSGLDGYYRVRAQVYVSLSSTTFLDLKIRKNGAAGTVLSQARGTASDGNPIIQVSCTVPLVATDYVELYAMCNGGSKNADSAVSMFEIELAGV